MVTVSITVVAKAQLFSLQAFTATVIGLSFEQCRHQQTVVVDYSSVR